MMDKKNEKSKPDLSGYHKGYRNLNTYKTDVKASPPEIAANTLLVSFIRQIICSTSNYDSLRNNS